MKCPTWFSFKLSGRMLPWCDVQWRELAASDTACQWRWTPVDISCIFAYMIVVIINVRVKDAWQGACFHSVGVIQWVGGHEVKVVGSVFRITGKNTGSWLRRGGWRCHYDGEETLRWIVILVNRVLARGIWLVSLNEVRLESYEKETVSLLLPNSVASTTQFIQGLVGK